MNHRESVAWSPQKAVTREHVIARGFPLLFVSSYSMPLSTLSGRNPPVAFRSSCRANPKYGDVSSRITAAEIPSRNRSRAKEVVFDALARSVEASIGRCSTAAGTTVVVLLQTASRKISVQVELKETLSRKLIATQASQRPLGPGRVMPFQEPRSIGNAALVTCSQRNDELQRPRIYFRQEYEIEHSKIPNRCVISSRTHPNHADCP